MATRTCWSCGTTYDAGEWGLGSCPVCAVKKEIEDRAESDELTREEERRRLDRQEELTREAIEEAAFRTEMAVAHAADKRRETEAESWKLQAQSKTNRAYDLYKAGMYPEAFDLAEQARQDDKGNIVPYMVAAWALEAGGSHVEASWYYTKQIELLRMPENRDSVQTILQVLRGLPDDPGLREKFSSLLAEISARWKGSPGACELLCELLEKDFLTEARSLMQSLSRGPGSVFLDSVSRNASRTPEWIALTHKLIDRSLLREARLFLEFYSTEILLGQLYLLAVRISLGESPAQQLKSFLAGIPFDKGGEVLDAFKHFAANGDRFPASTIRRVREEIQARYEQWKPEIASARQKLAREKLARFTAQEDAAIKDYCSKHSLATPARLFWTIWLGSWLAFIILGDRLQALGYLGLVTSEDLVQVSTVVWFIVSGAVAWRIAMARHKMVVNEIVNEACARDEKSEMERWGPVLNAP